MPSGKMWGYLGDLIGFVMVVLGAFFLLTLNQTLLASFALFFYALTAGIAAKDVLGGGKWGGVWYAGPVGGVVGAAVSFASYILLVFILAPMAAAFAAPPAGLQGIGPPTLLLLIGGAWLAYIPYSAVFGYASATTGGVSLQWKILAITLIAFVFGGWYVHGIILQGSWANAGQVVGGAGYGLEQSLGGAADEVASAWSGFSNTVLNPHRNPQMARITCAVDFAAGGGMFQAAAGGTGMQECVDQYLGQNQTESRSRQVSAPVRLQVQDVELEPFSNRIRVIVPLTNTYVTDVQGRPIDIPARNVTLNVTWHYLDRTVAWHTFPPEEDRPMDLRNGDTRTIEFDENGGDPIFRTFRIQAGVSNNEIESRLLAVKESCGTDGSGCESAQNWFLWRLNGSDRYERMAPERVVFMVNANENVNWYQLEWSEGDQDVPGIIVDAIDGADSIADLSELEYLMPRLDYTVNVDARYNYSAQAAFTESNRWKSGNQLLELWTANAWDQLTFEERQSWQQRKCAQVERFGQEIEKQRTAALTTPIVPVMYVDCGGTLFQEFDEDTDGDGNPDHEYDIFVGATVSAKDSIDREKGFKVTSIRSDCKQGSDMTSYPETGDVPQPEFQEGAGWTFNPITIERFDNIAGQRKTINCRVDMNFIVNLEKQAQYTIPQLGGS